MSWPRGWGGAGGGDGLLFQEPGSKASFSTSFTPRNPKYCLGALCRVQFETCNHNFSDSQLKGSIFIRQMCSRKKSKTGGKREDTEKGQVAEQTQQTCAEMQNTKWSPQLRPLLHLLNSFQEKLAWSKGEGKSREHSVW